METLKQAHGNYVTGDRFWNRVEEIALFKERVRDGAHLLLVAQRRMGKTSLMKEAARQLEGEFLCVFVDFQNDTTPQDAVAKLGLALQSCKTIWLKVRDVFSNVMKNIEKVEIKDLGVTLRSGLTGANWQAKGDELFKILADEAKPVLLLFDEVPILVNRIIKGQDYRITSERRQVAGEFMSWLRKNSLQHQGKLRIVISGSIGFEPVLRQADLSASVNNFVPFELNPWQPKTAIGCLCALAKEYDLTFSDNAESAVVEHLGCCIPNHVQMFFDHAKTYSKRHGGMAIGPADVDTIYKSEMLSVRGHAELTHYEERLKLVLGNDRMPLAMEMITEAAVTGCLTAKAIKYLGQDFKFDDDSTLEVQKDILWILEHDGYLTQTAEGYTFVSKLLRDWWVGRHKMFFTPVSEREG